MKIKYWYAITRTFCEMGAHKIEENRERVFSKEKAVKETISIPVCEDCYRGLKL